MTDDELDWPDQFNRTPPEDREPYPHGFRVDRRQAINNILTQLERWGADTVKIETGAQHQTRNPHYPYKNASPDDPGAVVHWEKNGEQFVAPCDQWDNLRDNLQSISKHLEAKRGLERWGVHTMEGEFEVYKLPPPGSEDRPMEMGASHDPRPPHKVLGVSPDADPDVVRQAAKVLQKKHHPDKGGNVVEFKRVTRAKEAMLGDG